MVAAEPSAWLGSTIALAGVLAWIGGWAILWAIAVPVAQRSLHADGSTALIALLGRCWTRRMHRWRLEGFTTPSSLLFDDPAAGPIIVVCNHASGVDPILVQMAFRRKLRWFMAADQMHGVLGWFWRLQHVIPVHYDRRDTHSMMAAMSHLREGAALGVFPEGGIEAPPGQVYRFMGGFAQLAARTNARVVVLSLAGIPAHAGVLRSLFVPCRTVVRLVAILDPPTTEQADEFTESVRALIAASLGLPMADGYLDHIVPRVRAATPSV